MARRTVWLLGLITLGASATALWLNRRLFLVNDITTGESAAYPHLRSRVYYATPAAVLDAAAATLRALPKWRLIFTDAHNNALEAEAETPALGLLSDVTVYAIDTGNHQTRVTIRARSRLGGGDLGWNAAHIRTLQQALDERLTGDAAF